MQPQIDLIKDMASEENWSVTCEGVSGEMTVVRLSRGFFASAESGPRLREQVDTIASSSHALTLSESDHPSCDLAPPIVSVDGPNLDPAIAFGTSEMLNSLLSIAQSCGFEEASISAIRDDDRAMYQAIYHESAPAEWLAIYAGPKSAERYGPITCYTLMSNRHQNSEQAE